MINKLLSCFVVLAWITLVHGTKHEELLDGGFSYFPGVGYYLYESGRNWTYAQTFCTATEARLAVINSEVERQTIVAFLHNHTQDAYIYGGFTNHFESQYVTTEGIPIKDSGYTKWETGKPSGAADRCGGINTKTGELTDLACDVTSGYICEHQLWVDYTYVEGLGYYKLHTEGKGWADAYDVCKSEGAHLMVINSEAEADVANDIFNQHPDLPDADYQYEVWLGFRAVMDDLTADPTKGTYLTVFGTSISDAGYAKWYSDQPVVGNGNYCGSLVKGLKNFFMLRCSLRNAFFCEKELEAFKKA